MIICVHKSIIYGILVVFCSLPGHQETGKMKNDSLLGLWMSAHAHIRLRGVSVRGQVHKF